MKETEMTFEEIGYEKVMDTNEIVAYELKVPVVVRISLSRQEGIQKVMEYPSRRFKGAKESDRMTLTISEEMAVATALEEWISKRGD